jgi:hypothetical protein
LHASAGNCQICRTVYKETLHAAELLLLMLPPTKRVFLQVAEVLLVFSKISNGIKSAAKETDYTLGKQNKTKQTRPAIYIYLFI